MNTVIGIGIGLGIAIALYVVVSLLRKRKPWSRVFSTIDGMRSVGELSVFKVITKEIVTADKHVLGDAGKRFFNWILSSKKMAMIITFEIDFRYNLQSPEFVIESVGEQEERRYTLTMPKCFYETHIEDIFIYDEQRSELLPALVPDILSKVFGGSFSETDKNALISDAKKQAASQAQDLVTRMRSEVQSSARQTLEALARGFGAKKVEFDFTSAELVPTKGEAEAAA